jgi:hypothetical protein
MGQELDRELPILSKATPAAYFIGYTLVTTQRAEVTGSNGALLSSQESRSRWLETQVRVGSYDLDKTHKVGNSPSGGGGFATSAPLEDDAAALRRTIWEQTQGQYRAASEALIKITTTKEVQARTPAEHAADASPPPQKEMRPSSGSAQIRTGLVSEMATTTSNGPLPYSRRSKLSSPSGISGTSEG